MSLNFLVQNYIRLEPGFFRARPLDFLVQNVGPFTTPRCGTQGSTGKQLTTKIPLGVTFPGLITLYSQTKPYRKCYHWWLFMFFFWTSWWEFVLNQPSVYTPMLFPIVLGLPVIYLWHCTSSLVNLYLSQFPSTVWSTAETFFLGTKRSGESTKERSYIKELFS